jgi:hypothetical protein
LLPLIHDDLQKTAGERSQAVFFALADTDALRAADAERAAALPAFLAAIERYHAASARQRAEPNPLFFVFHLLGAWRERSAYRPLARLLRAPRDDLDHLLGDAITVTSHRVMAAVFDGDPQPLYDIVLDPEADQFIRSRMCEALAMVTLRDELPRAEAARFLRQCWDDGAPKQDCFVWNGWQSAIAMLGLAELKPLVKEAFDRGVVDSTWLAYGDFESDFEYASGHDGLLPHASRAEYALFGDVIEELSTWSGFTPEYQRAKQRRNETAARASGETIVTLFPKIGRNEPCPCGSGRKFKKCCLNVTTFPGAEYGEELAPGLRAAR